VFTLYQAIDSCTPPVRMNEKPLRIPIYDHVQITGVGTVALGRITQGSLKRGDSVILQPHNLRCDATSIEQHHVDRAIATAGDLIGFRVKNAARRDLRRGLVACAPSDPVPAVLSFTAQIILLSHPGDIRVGYTPFFMCHTASFPCRFTEFVRRNNRHTGAVLEENPNVVRQGDSVIARLSVLDNKPVCLEPFRDCAPLGRFIIRDMDLTVGVGIVTSIEEVANANTKTTKTCRPVKKSKYFKK
jgi:elongation factor 1-alpha